jgi:hypothetical protein
MAAQTSIFKCFRPAAQVFPAAAAIVFIATVERLGFTQATRKRKQKSIQAY